MYCCKSCQVVAWKAGHKNECECLQGQLEAAQKKIEKGVQRRGSPTRIKKGQLAQLLTKGISLSYMDGLDGSSCVEHGLKSIENFEQAKALAEFLGDIKGQWTSSFGLGIILASLGQIEKSVDLMEQCLVISRKQGHSRQTMLDEGIVYRYLGHNFMVLGQYEKAMEFLEKSMAISKNTGDLNTSDPGLLGICCRYARVFTLPIFVCVSVDLMPMAYGRLLGHYEQAVGFHEQAFVQNNLRQAHEVSILTYFHLCDTAMLFLKH